MFYYDYTFYLFIIPALIISLIAQINVKSTYSKYSKIQNTSHMSGADAARHILDINGLRSVRVEVTPGELTDHYDPKTDVVRLSQNVYSGTSVAAVGVAAHEAGHAVQHAEDYAPMKLRAAIIPITNIGSNLSFPLVILGVILGSSALAYAGVILFSLVTVFQLVTLPVEFNASRRAICALEDRTALPDEDIKGSRAVLRAAALTYVAALFVSLLNLLRLLAIARRSDR